MSEWTSVPFGRIAKKLVNGGTPPTDVSRYWTGHIPWITGADFTPSGIGEFRRFISEEAVRQTATNVIQQGQLLLVTRTGVGKLAIAPCDIAISQDITGVYVDEDLATTEFIFHRMRQGVEDLKKLNQGTSINGIIRSDLASYRVELPPLNQQRRIAEILSTLDEAIEQTETLIAKMQQVKAGLMHDLFTRGVTPDDHLRPSRELAPELYKESDSGWIPKEWEVKSLGDSFTLQRGFDITQEQQLVGDIPVVSSSGITSYHSIAMCKGPGVVIGRKGNLGDAYYINGPYWPHDTSLWVKDFHGNDPKFARFFLIWMRLERFDAATSVPTLNRNFIHPLRIAIPKLSEQIDIVSRIETHDAAIRHTEVQLEKLQMLKQGLMHDLLTGRVRVKTKDRGETQ